MLTTVACYLLQLFADFSGYTNIALGIGKLFGVEGPPNFNAPFSATNIREYWRRSHMSLTALAHRLPVHAFVDVAKRYGQAGLIGAIFLNMIMIGIWHAFTLNYLVFGILQAVFLSVTVQILGARARRKRVAGKTNQVRQETWVWRRLVPFLGTVLTFALMSFSMIFFHSRTWDQAMSVLAQVSARGKRVDRLVGHTGLSGGAGVDLHGDRSLCRVGDPASRALSQSVGAAVPHWLQYGVCLFLLTVLSTAGKWTFHLWSILTKTDLGPVLRFRLSRAASIETAKRARDVNRHTER